MLVVIIFVVLFAGTAISTANKTLITWSATKEDSFVPTTTNLTFDAGSMSMMALGVIGFDLNNASVRYFDAELV